MAQLQRIVRGERQKELARLFDVASQRHNRWTVWSDAMLMFAIAISNAVDLIHREFREQLYMDTIKKYNQKEVESIAYMFGLVVDALDENPDQDFLGELYMSLELGNKNNGQFFTPYNLCVCNAKLQCNVAEMVGREHWSTVNDPACGAGALLVAFANEARAQGVNYQKSVLFTAQDIDMVTASMCYVQLSLLGCPGYVVVGDTLAHPATSYDRRGLIPVDNGNIWYTPMYYSDIWQGRRIAWQMDHMVFRPSDPGHPVFEETSSEATMQEPQSLEETSAGQLSLF